MELWPHQHDASRDIQSGWQDHSRLTCVMPCGTGKTVVGAHAGGQAAPTGRRILVAPTVELLSQLLDGWAAVVQRDELLGRLAAVCSDPTAMTHRDGVDVRVRRAAVINSPEELAATVPVDGPATVACTYDSLPLVAEAHSLHGLSPWNVALADEAHRTAGARGRRWSTVHHDHLVPSARRLYMTATPRIVGATGQTGDTGLVGMDDERVYGPQAHHLSYAKAFQRGLLAGYQVIVACVSQQEVRNLVNDLSGARGTHYQVGSTAMTAAMLARQVAVLRAVEQNGIRRMITYHHRVRDAHWFARTLPQVADWMQSAAGTSLITGCIYGDQPSSDRREVFDLLRRGGTDGETAVVSNARVLTEGVDAPDVDAVAFIDSRDSVIDVVQAVGRALRLGGRTHKTASVIIPVFLEDGQDHEEALDSSAWSSVWRVLRALRSHDERLAVQLDTARRSLGIAAGAGDELHRMPEWLQVTGMEVPEDFAAAIYTRLVRATTPAWEEYYGATQAYARKNGTANVPASHVTETGLYLGNWVNAQRARKRAGRLWPENASRLDALGIVWNPQDAYRQDAIAAAQAFAAREGHLRVPQEHHENGFPLGSFVRSVRTGVVKVSEEERTTLTSLGIVWEVRDHDGYWEQMMRAARKYRDREGHLRVPARHVEPGDPPGVEPGDPPANLGAWIAWNRQPRAKLSPERRKELTDLGMVWDIYEYFWQRKFAELKKFYDQNGHLDLPLRYTVDIDGEQVDLYAWHMKLRSYYKNDALKFDRVAALEGIGMIWNERQRKIQEARRYFKKHGNLRVPKSYRVTTRSGKVVPLGGWLAAQRRRYQKGELDVETVITLTEIGMEWPKIQ